MTSPIKVLIVDDHPFIIQAYKNAIDKYSLQGYTFEVTQASDCKSGYEQITNPANHFNLAMFDISMPEYAEKGIHSGEDLAKLMTEKMPDCKIMLLTMHTELLKINNIIKNIHRRSPRACGFCDHEKSQSKRLPELCDQNTSGAGS